MLLQSALNQLIHSTDASQIAKGIILACATALITWFFTRNKTTAEVEGLRTKNDQDRLKIQADLEDQIEEHITKLKKIRKECIDLEDKNSALERKNRREKRDYLNTLSNVIESIEKAIKQLDMLIARLSDLNIPQVIRMIPVKVVELLYTVIEKVKRDNVGSDL